MSKLTADPDMAAAPSTAAAKPTSLERVLGLFTAVHPGEGKRLGLFFGYAFVLLLCYYLLKTIREPLLLEGGSAEAKSYAYAAVAAILLVLVPVYGVLFRRTERAQLVRSITTFFVANLGVFYLLGSAGIDIGFAYYVWVGVFSVTILAQFWAHAAHAYKVESGQRLFPVIMAGAALGGLVGPSLSRTLYPLLGPWNLLLLAMALLAATLPLVERTRAPAAGTGHAAGGAPTARSNVLGGFALVMSDRYLLLLAAAAVLLNCVNTTGEYILTELVLRDAEQRMIADPTLDKGDLIAAFYGDFYLAVNTLSMLFQMFLVARIFRWIGVRGATVILPVIALVSYGLVAFLPIFGIIRAVKIFENCANYSIANTARHVLYLPLPDSHKFEGKTTIDTFFWRLGDVVQAGFIYVGVNVLGFEIEQFAMLNMVLAVVWIVLAVQVGKRYAAEAHVAPSINWRALAAGACSVAFAAFAFSTPSKASAAEPLFAEHETLAIEVIYDGRALCRGSETRECADTPAEVRYTDGAGTEHRVTAQLRVRGKWRADGGNCRVPPLFLYFDDATTADTAFAGQRMLPLTTHCRNAGTYEQYVLKEYLAYRIYNLLTDKSLRVRLTRIAYRDDDRDEPTVRYAFFTEHFDSLAARHDSQSIEAAEFEPLAADPNELATFALFEYLIGNTDWSAVRGHNVTHIRDASGLVTAVPFDFDFSGLVNADYAGPAPSLPIKSVTQRLFRGFCQPGYDWQQAAERLAGRRGEIAALVDGIPDLEPKYRAQVHAFLERYYEIAASPEDVEAQIERACRKAV